AAFYPESYEAYALPERGLLRLLAPALVRRRYRRTLERPPLVSLRRLPPGRLLDVGSGRGDLGVALGKLGWQVTGVEPSPQACEQARARGVPTFEGTLETATGLGAGYDAVVFQHSLEHAVEASDELARAHAVLRDGGLLLVSVPNFGCRQRRVFGSAWFDDRKSTRLNSSH